MAGRTKYLDKALTSLQGAETTGLLLESLLTLELDRMLPATVPSGFTSEKWSTRLSTPLTFYGFSTEDTREW